MNASPDPSAAPDAAVAPAAPAPTFAATPVAVPVGWVVVACALALLAVAALGFAWSTQDRVRALEETLVKRQQESQEQAAEARIAARQAQEAARESAARVAMMEVRVAESTLQRSQVDELVQSLARTRDENVLSDVEVGLRAAMQQAAITGGAQPLLVALQQADDRLARFDQPRLERVRQAIRQDVEALQSVAIADPALLTKRLDEAIAIVDALPLLARADTRRTRAAAPAPVPASAASAAPPNPMAVDWSDRWRRWLDGVWSEVRGLVRVTPIDQPEAMLVAPEQAFFLRENLKLRLLNARLALLSRQFDTARSDLRDARLALERYFDRTAADVQSTIENVQQVAAQARQVSVPRPDATLAAIAAATPRR